MFLGGILVRFMLLDIVFYPIKGLRGVWWASGMLQGSCHCLAHLRRILKETPEFDVVVGFFPAPRWLISGVRGVSAWASPPGVPPG